MQNKSGLRFHLKAYMTDGTVHDIETIPFDIVLWERYSKSPFKDGAGRAEMLAYLAYTSGYRNKLFSDQRFDDWAAKLVDLDVLDDDDDAEGPTPPAEQPSS